MSDAATISELPLSLEGLARAAADGRARGLGLTLTAGGSIITGEIAGPADYWGHFTTTAHRGEVSLDAIAALAGGVVQDPFEQMIEAESHGDVPRSALYLRDVQMFSAGTKVELDWYRVFTAHVTGYTLGRTILG